jgi:hypothetical protein
MGNCSIYRAPNEDIRVIERLAIQTNSLGNSTKHSIIAGDLDLPYVEWNGNTLNKGPENNVGYWIRRNLLSTSGRKTSPRVE